MVTGPLSEPLTLTPKGEGHADIQELPITGIVAQAIPLSSITCLFPSGPSISIL